VLEDPIGFQFVENELHSLRVGPVFHVKMRFKKNTGRNLLARPCIDPRKLPNSQARSAVVLHKKKYSLQSKN